MRVAVMKTMVMSVRMPTMVGVMPRVVRAVRTGRIGGGAADSRKFR